MLLQPVVLTGVAQFTGVGGTITYASAAIYPIQETIKANQVFEYEPIKDPSGFDLAWSARNNCYDIDLGMKLMDSTGYGSSPSGGSVANAISGALFPAPISTITLAGFGGADSADIPWLNSIYQVLSGSNIDLSNIKCGEMTWKVRWYASAAQRALIAITPSS